MPTLSVICPVYNEEEGIQLFYDRLKSVLAQLPKLDHEIVLVDDGSRDGSPQIMQQLAESDPDVVVYRLSRNFGHQAAITCGMESASGDVVVIIDSDLQDPPELILDMVREWREGADVVYAQRRVRHGESRFKVWTADSFYRLLSRMSDVPIPRNTGDFRLMDRKVLDAVNGMPEEGRYVRGLVSWVGFDQRPLEYDRDARAAGETHYPLGKMLKLALDGLTGFSEKPLRVSSLMGFASTAVAFGLALYVIVAKILNPESSLSGFATTLAVILLMGGLQFLFIGLLGEYVARIARQVRGRPHYVVGRVYGGRSDA